MTPEPGPTRALPTRPPPPPPGSPSGAGQFATAALTAVVGVEAVLGATAVVGLLRLPARISERRQEELFFADGWEIGLSLAQFGVYLIAAIAWMTWQAQAHGNLQALRRGRYFPAVVWLFLVPIANLIVPYRAVADLARSGTDRPWLRRWWWGTFLLLGFLQLSTLSTESLGVALGLQVAAALVAIASATLGVQVLEAINASIAGLRSEAGWPAPSRDLSRRARWGWATGAAGLATLGGLGFGALLPSFMAGIEEALRPLPELAVGECFQLETLAVISCDSPHDAEIYHLALHPEQAVYPGASPISGWAEPICYDRFEPYTGVAYPNSHLGYDFSYPGPEAWQQGDRRVLCYLFDPRGEPLTESAAA